MLKPVIAATALFAIAGSSFVYAQQGFGGHGGSTVTAVRASNTAIGRAPPTSPHSPTRASPR